MKIPAASHPETVLVYALINGWSVQVFDEIEQYGYIRYHISSGSEWVEAFIKRTSSGTLRFAHGFAPAGHRRERIRSAQKFQERLRGNRRPRQLRGLLTPRELVEAGAIFYAERPSGEKIYTPHPGVVDVGYSVQRGKYMGISNTWPNVKTQSSSPAVALSRIMDLVQDVMGRLQEGTDGA